MFPSLLLSASPRCTQAHVCVPSAPPVPCSPFSVLQLLLVDVPAPGLSCPLWPLRSLGSGDHFVPSPTSTPLPLDSPGDLPFVHLLMLWPPVLSFLRAPPAKSAPPAPSSLRVLPLPNTSSSFYLRSKSLPCKSPTYCPLCHPSLRGSQANDIPAPASSQDTDSAPPPKKGPSMEKSSMPSTGAHPYPCTGIQGAAELCQSHLPSMFPPTLPLFPPQPSKPKHL